MSRLFKITCISVICFIMLSGCSSREEKVELIETNQLEQSKTDDKTDNTQKPSQPTTDKTTNSVKTGDNTVMSSYAIMMLLAAGAYTAIKKTAE